MMPNIYQQILAVATDAAAIKSHLINLQLNEDNANMLVPLVMFVAAAQIPEQQKQLLLQSAVDHKLNQPIATTDNFYALLKTCPSLGKLLFTAVMQGRPEIIEALLQLCGIDDRADSKVREQILWDLNLFGLIEAASKAYMANYTHGRHHDLASYQIALQYLITTAFRFCMPLVLQQHKDIIMQAAACFVDDDPQQILPNLFQMLGIVRVQDIEAVMSELRNLAAAKVSNFNQEEEAVKYMDVMFNKCLGGAMSLGDPQCLIAAAAIAADIDKSWSGPLIMNLTTSLLAIASVHGLQVAQTTMQAISALTRITMTQLILSWFSVFNDKNNLNFDAWGLQRVTELLDDEYEPIADLQLQNKLHNIAVTFLAIGRFDLAQKLIAKFHLDLASAAKQQLVETVAKCFRDNRAEQAQTIMTMFQMPQLPVLLHRLLMQCNIYYYKYDRNLPFVTSDPFDAMIRFVTGFGVQPKFQLPSAELLTAITNLDTKVEPININEHDTIKQLSAVVLMLLQMNRLDLADKIAQKSGLSLVDILLNRAKKDEYLRGMLVFLFIKLGRTELASDIMARTRLDVSTCFRDNLFALGAMQITSNPYGAINADTTAVWLHCVEVLLSLPQQNLHKIELCEMCQSGMELFAKACLARNRPDLVRKALSFCEQDPDGMRDKIEKIVTLYELQQEHAKAKQQIVTNIELQQQKQNVLNKGMAQRIIAKGLIGNFEKTVFFLLHQLAHAGSDRLNNTKSIQLLVKQVVGFKQVIDTAYNASCKNFATSLPSLEAMLLQSKQAEQPQILVLANCAAFTKESRGVLIIQPQADQEGKYDIWYINPGTGAKMPVAVKALIEELFGKEQSLNSFNEIILPQYKRDPKSDGGGAGGEMMSEEAESAWEANAIAAITQANQEERRAVKQGQ